jgi:hypothetical protein
MRNLAFVVMLALLALAVPAISQGDEKKSLENRVVELIERVDELEKQNAQLLEVAKDHEARLRKEEEWTKRQEKRNAHAASLAAYAMKKGYFYPAPANDAKAAILNAIATMDGRSIKTPKGTAAVPPVPGEDPWPPDGVDQLPTPRPKK